MYCAKLFNTFDDFADNDLCILPMFVQLQYCLDKHVYLSALYFGHTTCNNTFSRSDSDVSI